MSTPFDLPRTQKRQLRDLAGTAHTRELERALDELESQFKTWRAGEIDAHELSDRIHQFHNGPARELWKVYAEGDLRLSVASALARGVLQESELDEELRALFERYKSLFETGPSGDAV